MKQSAAMTLLVLACAISAPAIAQSTLRPMDATAANMLSGNSSAQVAAPMSAAPSATGTGQSATAMNQDPIERPVLLAPMPTQTASGYTAQPVAARSSFLPAGTRLSVALDRFVRERGWDLRWQIAEDYVLDVNLPIPAADLIESVTWVVQTYQSQGGMYGVVPRFARSNRVVVIEKMDVRDNY